MEDCEQLLAVVRNEAAAHEWADTCSRLKSVFETLPGDTKAALVSGDDCVPALLHAVTIGRQGSGGDDVAGLALVGACDALNALITGLPKELKQELLGGDKGIVDALLRVLADTRGKRAWGSVACCFRNMFLDVAAEVRQQLLSDGRGIVEAIVGVLEGEEAAAWAAAGGALNSFLIGILVSTKQLLLSSEKGILVRVLRVLRDSSHGAWGSACSFMSAFVADIPSSAKSVFLLSQPQLVPTIIVCLDSDDAHSSWAVAMELLKRLVCNEASLSHINLCTLNFLKADSGLMAFLVRCGRGLNSEADSAFFAPAFGVFRCMSRSINPCFLAVTPDVLALFIAAAQICTDDVLLRNAMIALSNFSEITEYCAVLDQVNCFEFAVSHISGMPASASEWNDGGSVATNCLSIVVNMCRNISLHEKLKKMRVIEILTPLAVASCAAELRVLMALSCIIGCKESGSDSSVVPSSAMSHFANATSIGKIIDCLENTLNLRGGPGYTFGFIVLPAILQVSNIFVTIGLTLEAHLLLTAAARVLFCFSIIETVAGTCRIDL
jgi:hypothetical protein